MPGFGASSESFLGQFGRKAPVEMRRGVAQNVCRKSNGARPCAHKTSMGRTASPKNRSGLLNLRVPLETHLKEMTPTALADLVALRAGALLDRPKLGHW